MCGKFTAMASWAEVVAFSQPLTADRDYSRANDEAVTLKVMGQVNVIVSDEDEKERKVVPMRWGFPHPMNWRVPQPIHARSETMDELKTFKGPFSSGASVASSSCAHSMRASRSPPQKLNNGRLIRSLLT